MSHGSNDGSEELLERPEILEQFSVCGKGRSKPPKKEYVRIKLIRGLKRALRQLSKDVTPRKTLHGFAYYDERAEGAWKRLKEVYFNCKSELDSKALTASGPITDGKAKREIWNSSIPRSYNKNFCAEFFNDEHVLRAWYFYVQLLFVDMNPTVLVKKFEMICCDSDSHNINCEVKWNELKQYFIDGMLCELDATPWTPDTIQLPAANGFIIRSNFKNRLVNKYTQTDNQ